MIETEPSAIREREREREVFISISDDVFKIHLLHQLIVNMVQDC